MSSDNKLRVQLFRHYIPLVMRPLFEYYGMPHENNALKLIQRIGKSPCVDRILIGPLADVNELVDPVLKGTKDEQKLNAMLLALPEIALYLQILIKKRDMAEMRANVSLLHLSYEAARHMYFDYIKMMEVTSPPVDPDKLGTIDVVRTVKGKLIPHGSVSPNRKASPGPPFQRDRVAVSGRMIVAPLPMMHEVVMR